MKLGEDKGKEFTETNNSIYINNSMESLKSNSPQKHVAVCCIGIVFILLFALNYILPINETDLASNRITRINNWISITFTVAAICYIIKLRKLSLRGLFFSTICGGICYVTSLLEMNLLTALMTGIPVAFVCYASFIIFETKIKDNETTTLGLLKSLKAFGIGALMGIPLAVGNVLYFVFQSNHSATPNGIDSAFFALLPAISEEVFYRFFFFALCMQWTEDTKSFRKFDIPFFLVTTLPFSLLHYVEDLKNNLFFAIIMTLILTFIFGLPHWLILKKKNLQMAIGFHWVMDFVRFFLGY